MFPTRLCTGVAVRSARLRLPEAIRQRRGRGRGLFARGRRIRRAPRSRRADLRRRGSRPGAPLRAADRRPRLSVRPRQRLPDPPLPSDAVESMAIDIARRGKVLSQAEIDANLHLGGGATCPRHRLVRGARARAAGAARARALRRLHARGLADRPRARPRLRPDQRAGGSGGARRRSHTGRCSTRSVDGGAGAALHGPFRGRARAAAGDRESTPAGDRAPDADHQAPQAAPLPRGGRLACARSGSRPERAAGRALPPGGGLGSTCGRAARLEARRPSCPRPPACGRRSRSRHSSLESAAGAARQGWWCCPPRSRSCDRRSGCRRRRPRPWRCLRPPRCAASCRSGREPRAPARCCAPPRRLRAPWPLTGVGAPNTAINPSPLNSTTLPPCVWISRDTISV